MTQIKQKAYNVETGRATTLSSLEMARINQVFTRIGDVLSSGGYEIRTGYVSVGECHCSNHRQIKFIVELGNELPINIIDDIKYALDPSIEFTNIISQRSKLVLVFVQNF
jgi:hypothetical protein